MSEEKGQNERGKVDFDSADIGKKEKAVQFTVVEGAEERARAAEKAKLAAEEEAIELHQADIEAAAAMQAKAKQREKIANGNIIYKLFAGWHKWLILGIILLIGVGIAVYFVFIKKPQEALPPSEAAKAYYEQQVAKIDNENRDISYVAAREEMLAKWESVENDDEKFWYGFYYARFIYTDGYDEKSAYEVLSGLHAPSDISDEQECEIIKTQYRFEAYELDLGVGNERLLECLE